VNRHGIAYDCASHRLGVFARIRGDRGLTKPRFKSWRDYDADDHRLHSLRALSGKFFHDIPRLRAFHRNHVEKFPEPFPNAMVAKIKSNATSVAGACIVCVAFDWNYETCGWNLRAFIAL
jgi:hypothetical protein